MKVTFLGGADCVTGSKYLVEAEDQKVLLDCGLFQGFKTHRERNWAPLAVPPHDIDAVVLSHAHLDHCGWLPVLVAQGFRGPIYATAATRDLTEVLLLDSAHLQEEDTRRANRGGWSKHHPALPLYDAAQARRAISKIVGLATGRSLRIGRLKIEFTPVGHLLGATAVTVHGDGRVLVFSGDLGRSDDILMPAPKQVTHADALLMESTYGNRAHPDEDVQARLGSLIRDTVGRGGSVLLPSFAVGRAQALLLVLQRLKGAGEIPQDLPIVLDSPMARTATAVYLQHRKLLRIAGHEADGLTDGVTLVQTPQQSQRLTLGRWPKVVISSSGMATGGRVLHYLKAMAPNPHHHIVFAGFQVAGTRGAHLVAGAGEVKIHGEYVNVKAQVSQIEGLSGHADCNGLVEWLRGFHQAPIQTYLVHGEREASDALRVRIQDQLSWRVKVPEHGACVEI